MRTGRTWASHIAIYRHRYRYRWYAPEPTSGSLQHANVGSPPQLETFRGDDGAQHEGFERRFEMSMDRKRIEPLEPEAWSDQLRALLGGTEQPVAALEGRAGARSSPPNILLTIARHPSLLQPFLSFATALAAHGVLPRRESELIALRAAWNCQSAFEWGHHVHYGRAAGLQDQEIRRIAAGPEAEGWSADDRSLLRAADALHAKQDVSDELWAELSQRWSPEQLVEIPFVVGHYTMLSMVAKTTGVMLEPGLPEMPGHGP